MPLTVQKTTFTAANPLPPANISVDEESAIWEKLHFPKQAQQKGYAATLNALLAEDPSDEKDFRIKQIVEAWGSEAPLACLEFLLSHGKGVLANGISWHRAAQKNPDAAWDLAKRSKGPRPVRHILGAIFDTNPTKAAALLQEANILRFDLTSEEEGPWAADKFAQWLDNQPPTRIGTELTAQNMGKWSETNPTEAADWYLAQAGNRPMIESDGTAKALIGARPDAFAARLAAQGSRITNHEDLGMTALLAVHRPDAVVDYINNLEPSPARITESWACVEIICKEKGPAAGVAFAKRVESGGARLDALANAFHSWSRRSNPAEKAKRQAEFDMLTPAEQAYVKSHQGNMPGLARFRK